MWVASSYRRDRLLVPDKKIKKHRNKEDLPGNLEAATFPKEQGSLPHDAFVFTEVHIFI